MGSVSEKTVAFWGQYFADTQHNRREHLNFWDVPSALLVQRKIAFPGGLGEYSVPAAKLLSRGTEAGTLKRGLSIGCGVGWKELDLLRTGLVQHMTLIEIVPDLVEAGKELYAEAGLLTGPPSFWAIFASTFQVGASISSISTTRCTTCKASKDCCGTASACSIQAASSSWTIL